jgi:hypothetical protein
MNRASADVDQSPREFKNRFVSFNNMFVLGVTLFVQAFFLYEFMRRSEHSLADFLCLLGLMGMVTLPQLLLWYLYNKRFIVTRDQLVLKQVDKSVTAGWDEITRIEDVWSFWGGSRAFCARTRHGTIVIPDTVNHCEELLEIIQERSGKRIISEWRGAKDSLREEWQALVRWVSEHKTTGLLLVLIVMLLGWYATRWAINEYRTYHSHSQTSSNSWYISENRPGTL